MSKLIFPTGHTYIRREYKDDDNHNLGDWEQNFQWTGREDYLEWVADWKLILKQKIASIRMEKADRRDKSLDTAARNAANCERQQLRIDCCNLLLIRTVGKLRAANQRNDRRNSIAA